MTSAYENHLDRNEANYTPLTPLSLIARTAYVYPNKVSVVHADRRYTWAETYSRSRRLASALKLAGIGNGDTVALMAANTPEMLEAHFGVPMSGGVLNTLNTRLDAEAIAFMLKHGEAKVLLTDTEFAGSDREPDRALKLSVERRRMIWVYVEHLAEFTIVLRQ